MAQESVITDAMRKRIGVELEPVYMEIEKGMIRKLAEAIEDPNPLWQDEEHAKKAGYGGIIAPPSLLCTVQMTGARATLETPLKRRLDGGIELEYYRPIKPGDALSCTAKIADLYEREARLGRMLFQITEVVYKNQKGEVVAKQRSTSISY